MISFSVIMPTYNQKGFIRNAIRSLFAQTYKQWELIIVDDGCTDGTKEFISDYLSDSRVTYLQNEKNEGIGYAINRALDVARYDYIAYLPSDDFYFSNHLEVMKDMFKKDSTCVLVYTQMKSELQDSLLDKSNEAVNGLVLFQSLQMVQTAHKKTLDRWVEREEYESEDLYKVYWYKLTKRGQFAYANEKTCNWTIQGHQRHKIISERYGGNINRFRSFYKVETPIRLKVSRNKFVDEYKQFEEFRNPVVHSPDGLKILIVGELSYNPERIYALEEAGHRLYGLWTQNPRFSFTNVGHLPFGNVEDLNPDDWESEIKRIKPDIIYGLLNFAAVSFAHEVLKKCRDIPFVWHFKEGPFLCLEHGLWEQLTDLFTLSDGVIYLNKVAMKWYDQYFPRNDNYMILDGDLPKKNIFGDDFSMKLSRKDEEIHTVVAGRMVGMDMDLLEVLAHNKIHVHLYTESYEECISAFITDVKKKMGSYFHQHKHCTAQYWTHEFSQYDAGWLHCIESCNHGDYSKMGWNDLNIPARVSTMMAAGVPCIELDNSEHIVAMQDSLKDIECGLFFKEIDDLIQKLQDKDRLTQLQNNVLKHRLAFSFDEHVPELINFFRKVISNKASK